ncbi:MAG: Hsp20/alpha crystallin family protein [Myxococcota bacterium]
METTTVSAAPAPARSAVSIAWYRPAVDVLEGPEGLKLVIDLPGVAPDQIEVRAENRVLTVQGKRADRPLGWRRAFTLAPTIDAQRIEARTENGVLYLTLPTAESAKPRRIEVR